MPDFLERNGLQTVGQHFKDLFLARVHRDRCGGTAGAAGE